MLALVGSVVVLVLGGIVTQGALLQKFPGITFFVQHLLIAFVFLFFWIVYVGLDLIGLIVGSVMLSLVWTTYGMYLGPQGLPSAPPTYLGYNDLWLKSFPGDCVSALLGLWLTTFLRSPVERFVTGLGGTRRVAQVLAVVAFVLFAPASAHAEGLAASASASGHAMMVVGPDPVNIESVKPAEGFIKVNVAEKGNRWSHVQNLDEMSVLSEFTSGDSSYRVTIDNPVPRHPLGKYTTWNWVIYRHEMHGETGIGTAKLPKMKPDIALYGWAEVTRDGKILSKMVFTHVMVTTEGPMKGIMLEVDTEEKTLLRTPDGYITVMWHDIESLTMPDSQIQTRQAVGWVVLIGLVAGFWALAVRAGRKAVPYSTTTRT